VPIKNGDATDPVETQHGKAHQPAPATKPRTREAAGRDRFSRIAWSFRREPRLRMIHAHQSRIAASPPALHSREDSGIKSLMRVYHVTVETTGRHSLRMKSVTSFVAVSVALLAGLAWCSGPCCPSQDAGGSSLEVGATPCCGSADCRPSVQPANDLASAPHPPTLPPVALLGVCHPTPDASASSHLVVFPRPSVPRPDLLRLDTPLLI
jgi:hypothetical protein